MGYIIDVALTFYTMMTLFQNMNKELKIDEWKSKKSYLILSAVKIRKIQINDYRNCDTVEWIHNDIYFCKSLKVNNKNAIILLDNFCNAFTAKALNQMIHFF